MLTDGLGVREDGTSWAANLTVTNDQTLAPRVKMLSLMILVWMLATHHNMGVCVCVYVCVYVCTYVCMFACMCEYVLSFRCQWIYQTFIFPIIYFLRTFETYKFNYGRKNILYYIF